MNRNQTESKPETVEQPSGEGLSSSALFGLAVMLERTVNDGWKTTVTTRQLLGYRYADSEDAAVGSFLRKSLADNKGFTAGQVLAMPIPLPNVQDQPHVTATTQIRRSNNNLISGEYGKAQRR